MRAGVGLIGLGAGPRRISLRVQARTRDGLRVSLRGGGGLVQVEARMVVVLIQAEPRSESVGYRQRTGQVGV